MEAIIVDDLRTVEVGAELWALSECLNSMEEQLARWADQASPGICDRLSAIRDKEEEQRAFHEVVDYALARLLRSMFIVSLWAVYEAAVLDFAELLKAGSRQAIQRKKKGRKKKDKKFLQDKGFLQNAEEVFIRSIQKSLFSDNEARTRLGDLQVLRHAIAHANGRLEANRNKKKILEMIKQRRGIREENGCLMFTEAFVRNAYADVQREIERLMRLVNRAGFTGIPE